MITESMLSFSLELPSISLTGWQIWSIVTGLASIVGLAMSCRYRRINGMKRRQSLTILYESTEPGYGPEQLLDAAAKDERTQEAKGD